MDITSFDLKSPAVGPVIGGQLYSHVRKGWDAIAYLSTGLIVFAAMMAFYGAGSKPLLGRLLKVLLKNGADGDPHIVMGPLPTGSTEQPASPHSQHPESLRNVTTREAIADSIAKQA
jgi:hypothetical protein